MGLTLQFDTRVNGESCVCLKLVSALYFLPVEHLGVRGMNVPLKNLGEYGYNPYHSGLNYHHQETHSRQDMGREVGRSILCFVVVR